ncbi:MAG TPA: GNAT family N-acetyltransferase [Candidatus Caccenecus avistercoris]|nr:GNAT family N-acetyltransferase [Candidatus Caccenecus avistercoris]
MRYKKVNKKDLPFLTECLIHATLPFIESDREKLKVIASMNDYVSRNYDEYTIIYNFLKPIGIYHLKNKELSLLYMLKEYQNKGLEAKVLNKIKDNISTVKISSKDSKSRKFYQEHGFIKDKITKEEVILRKDEDNEN